jgi:hypothetical protein
MASSSLFLNYIPFHYPLLITSFFVSYEKYKPCNTLCHNNKKIK